MKAKTILLYLLSGLSIMFNAAASTVEVRLATVAPKGSVWHDYLVDLDQDWRALTHGAVRLRIYAGTLGDEEDIMRRIRVGQINAAAVTTNGLSTVDLALTVFDIPMAFASSAELDFVVNRLARHLADVLERRGLIVLNWGEAGWVHFFTREPVITPDDLKREKLFVWRGSGSAHAEQIWKDLGFHPVPLSYVDILHALQTGMVTTVQAPPIAALANQWFALTGSMSEFRWAPLIGATVISAKAWAQIPEKFHPVLAASARRHGRILQQKVRDLEQDAIIAMAKRGLRITPTPPDARREWERVAVSVYPAIRGKTVPEEYFDRVMALRDEYRADKFRASQSKPQ